MLLEGRQPLAEDGEHVVQALRPEPLPPFKEGKQGH